MEIGRALLLTASCFMIIVSLLPLLRSPWWFIRIFDYPINQKFWGNLVLLVLSLTFARFEKMADLILISTLALNQFYLLYQIWRYTPLARIQMVQLKEEQGERIRLFIANVYQENRQADRCITLVDQYRPDMVLLVETDKWWMDAVDECLKDYRYRILLPLSNTYGMLLYSKLPIENYEIRFLVEPDIPSFTVDLIAGNGKSFRLYCLHPRPPVAGEADRSTDRDAEILIVGKEARSLNRPVIVAGDLNDVAWSFTTSLFLRVSGLLDPRIGRGFYSTFHASHRLMRWPLDHVFCSSHFYLKSIQRLGHIGSDHFPIFIEVALMPGRVMPNEMHKERPDKKDMEVAAEKIDEGLSGD